jgi:hypothetical protein
MPNYPVRKKKKFTNNESMESTVDDVIAYQEFKEKIAPELRNMLINGASAKEMLKKYENYAVAKLLTIALSDKDSGKALAAVKDILDRSQGKAVETKKLEHTMNDLSDEELDALLLSEAEDVSENGDSEEA